MATTSSLTNKHSFAGRPRPMRANRTDKPGGCPVCGDPLSQGGRFHHLRERHPAYWRVFLLRVAAPWVFLALMFGLAVAGGPAWSFMAVLLGFVGLSLWTRRRSITERRQPGSGLTRGEWLQGAGIGLVMMALALVVLGLLVVILR